MSFTFFAGEAVRHGRPSELKEIQNAIAKQSTTSVMMSLAPKWWYIKANHELACNQAIMFARKFTVTFLSHRT